VLNTFALTESIWSYFTSDAGDLHANKAETDLMLWLDPDACDMDQPADDADRTEGCIFSYPVALTSTNGVTGRPSEASAARGRTLLMEMGQALAQQLKQAQYEKPPLDVSLSEKD
jgi:creatinine amidohydrolase